MARTPFRHVRVLATIAAVVAAFVIATPSGATAAPKDPNGNTVVQLSNTTDCQDVVFLGLRGSGETANQQMWGMAPEVTAVYNAFVGSMKNRRIAVAGVDYASEAVPFAVWVPIAWQGYFASIDGGVDTTEAILINRAHNCPEEHFVLTGYSQGAMVLHRMVFDLSHAPADSILSKILPKIDAVATIGDGDRVAGDDVVTLGTSTNGPLDFGVGIYLPSGNIYKPTNQPLSSIGYSLQSRWFQVCDSGDLVCDVGVARLDPVGLPVGYAVHTKGYTKKNAAVVTAGQSAAAKSMSANPLQVSYNGDRAVVGTPYSGVFTRDFGYTLTTVTMTSGTLPPGLTFGGAGGGVTGTPTQVGSWTFSYRGTDRVGQTYDGSATIVVYPATTPAVQVATGNMHTCAVTVSGQVKCWGYGADGELGDGQGQSESTPTTVAGLSSSVVGIASGATHACAVTTTGAVYCWGSNGSGQLGDGTTTNRLAPTLVSGLPAVTSLAAGAYSTCALATSGVVYCWGDNTYGQLGDGTTIQRSLPAQVSGSAGVAAIGAGDFHTCAVQTSGTVKCWGRNSSGQLGNGTTSDRLVPAPLAGLGNGVADVSLAYASTCARLTDGSASCWGDNSAGQLGDGTTAQRLLPAAVTVVSSGIAQLTTSSAQSTCALLTSQSIRCWGNNDFGQLGNGSTQSSTQPTDVVGVPAGFTQVSMRFAHACAVTTDGRVACWGYNYQGQLGNGGNANSSIPVMVQGF